MKVFVSSTSYDLLDVRAEVANLLSEMKMTPVLSDQQSSDFDVKPQKNTIEVCLMNLRISDWVICILDQRYGPSLKKAGFDDVLPC